MSLLVLSADVMGYFMVYNDPKTLAALCGTCSELFAQIINVLPNIVRERGYLGLDDNNTITILQYLNIQEQRTREEQLYHVILNNRLDLIPYWITPNIDVTLALRASIEINDTSLFNYLVNNFKYNATDVLEQSIHIASMRTIKRLIDLGADATTDDLLVNATKSDSQIFNYVKSLRGKPISNQLGYRMAIASVSLSNGIFGSVVPHHHFTNDMLTNLLKIGYRNFSNMTRLVARGARISDDVLDNIVKEDLVDHLTHIVDIRPNILSSRILGLAVKSCSVRILNYSLGIWVKSGTLIRQAVRYNQLQILELLVNKYNYCDNRLDYDTAILDAIDKEDTNILDIILPVVPYDEVVIILNKINISESMTQYICFIIRDGLKNMCISKVRNPTVIKYIIDTGILDYIRYEQPQVDDIVLFVVIEMDDTKLLYYVLSHINKPSIGYLLLFAAYKEAKRIVKLLLNTNPNELGYAEELTSHDLTYCLKLVPRSSRHITQILLDHGACYDPNIPSIAYVYMHRYSGVLKYLIKTSNNNEIARSIRYLVDKSIDTIPLIKMLNSIGNYTIILPYL